MMKKSIGICSALLLVCSSAAIFTACSDKGITKIEFATYESWQEGFYNINMMDGFGKISPSEEQAHGGERSAKLQPLGSSTDAAAPYFYYPMLMEGEGGYNYADFSKMSSVEFWLYNAEAETVKFDLTIVASVADVYGVDYKTVGTYELAPGKWTRITYEPDYEALQNMCDITNVAGIGFSFENKHSASLDDAPVLYLDDLTLYVSEEALAEIKTSEPARGEMQSFDLASSLVYVRMESGLDFSETYLAAGSDKLPEGAKGGVEFAITDSEMGTWPRLHFDSRTEQTALEGADRFSLQLYFGTADENVKQVELHMFPDTTSEYVEYVPTNVWTKVTIDSELMFNNWGDSVGVKSRGLFWLQNGGSGCFNAIDTIRVADIRAEFDEIRIPDLADGAEGEEYTMPAATLEVDGKTVTAESWGYAVTYANADLCGGKYPEIAVTDRKFTPPTGGTFVLTYTATYQGKTYTASREIAIARTPSADKYEIESFDDPAALESIRMNSGTGSEYTAPTYLWEGDAKLPKGAKGGVEYTIDPTYSIGFDGNWPRFYVNSRALADAIREKDSVLFDIYIDAPDHTNDILLEMYPDTLGYANRLAKYVAPNKWVTVRVDAAQFADFRSRVQTDSNGFFWVQNGDPANIIDHIRIANIRAENIEEVRKNFQEAEIELFADGFSADNITVTDAASTNWVEKDGEKYISATPNYTKNADGKYRDNYLDISIRARKDLAYYQGLVSQGYNAVTLDVMLVPAEGNTSPSAVVRYWGGYSFSGGTGSSTNDTALGLGKWVTLTFDLETYLAKLAAGSGRNVTFLSINSTGEMDGTDANNPNRRLQEVRIRNARLSKAEGIIAMQDGAEKLFLAPTGANVKSQSTYYAAGSSEIPTATGSVDTSKGAVALEINKEKAAEDCWPNILFASDKAILEGASVIEIDLYFESASSNPFILTLYPDSADHRSHGYSVRPNTWVTIKLDAAALRDVYGWTVTDVRGNSGVNYTNLLWFENPASAETTVWIAGVRTGGAGAPVSFVQSGITVEGNNTSVSVDEYERWDGDTYLGTGAWLSVNNTSARAYKLTITAPDGTPLVRGEDYGVSNNAEIEIFDPAAGNYTFTFESYNGSFNKGSVTVTVNALNRSVNGLTDQNGSVNTPFTLPVWQKGTEGETESDYQVALKGASKPEKVVWSVSYTFNGGASQPYTEATFTPTQAGEYEFTYTAVYGGETYTDKFTLTVVSYSAEMQGSLTNGKGTTGSAYTIEGLTPVLKDVEGETVEVGDINWLYSVAYSDETVYNELYDEISLSEMTFTPQMAGTYIITATAEYQGETYTATCELTVERKPAAADEIESFDDAYSLQSVKLTDTDTGHDYEVSYLKSGAEELKDVSGAKGGVLFTRPAGDAGNAWPNLFFSATRMTSEQIKGYSNVVIPIYIAADDDVARIHVDIGGQRVIVATNTWVELRIPAAHFADRVGTENSIFFIQDGGDGSHGKVTAVRIASIYGEKADAAATPALIDMNTLGAFTGQDVWADSGLSTDIVFAENDIQSSTNNYFHRSLAPAGMPEGYERVVKFEAQTTSEEQWANVYARTLSKAEVQAYMQQGYATMSFWLYVEVPQGSTRTTLQIRRVPDGQEGVYQPQEIAVGQWVKLEVALAALVERMDETTGQVIPFWAYVPTSSDNPISAIWMTGFTFENPGRIEIVDFSSDATAKFDTSTEGDKPNVSAEWVPQENLPGSTDKPQNGAVKLSTQSGVDANVRVLSEIDKELYRSGYTAKILVYFEKSGGGEVGYSTVHWGSDTATATAQANTWVEIEVPAYQNGDANDLYDVNSWFANGYTGWLRVNSDQGVTAIYVAGVWLE